ncbi:MAG: ribonuclease P protein component [candidate division Zixibacteria bacterium]|nr:ribonuclease P protein component [candidate division Zixibacteria bacterium]MDH3936395.1 ribonuclease P protein component [candidate division Zixibacteria bacterium]MDH4033497.1 ribonuclease P protein component [candidate division Zixibacteria bacterium]
MDARNKLPRSDSLKNRREIDHLFSNGRRLSTPGHACVWTEADQFGYAVFVSRHHGSAVERNRIKRRFREVIRQVKALLDRPIKVGFIPSQQSTKSSFEQVYGEIQSTFKQINRNLS